VSRRIGGEAKAASVARALLGRLDTRGGAERALAVTAWTQVAGRDVASHARGFALREGELVVFVDSAARANDLTALSEDYREAVNMVLGKEAVSSMRFAVSKKVAEDKAWDDLETVESEQREADRVEPVPATETEAEQIRQMAAAVHDEKVREAVIAAAIRNLEWRKGIEASNGAHSAAQRFTGHDSH
jgi:hypothetical protein